MNSINWAKIKHILFVCTGNIYRSPVAEIYLRNQLSLHSIKIQSSSAGTSASKPIEINQDIRLMLLEGGVNLGDHLPKQIEKSDVDQADLIFYMSPDHHKYLIEQFSESSSKLHLLTDFYNGPDQFLLKSGILDPNHKNLLFHTRTFETIKICIDCIILEISKK